MQTCTSLLLVMTLIVSTNGDDHDPKRVQLQQKQQQQQLANVNTNHEPSAGTSYSAQQQLNAGLSAYHRLRHSERQRRRLKMQMHRKLAAAEFARTQTDEIFDDLRRQFKNDAALHHHNTNTNTNTNKARRTHHLHHAKDLTTKRERNEALCEVRRNTVHMNTPTEEYDPPFMVEVRCRNVAHFERSQGRSPLRPQGCVHDLLRCVQVFKDVHFSRRKIGSNSWYPYTMPNVPSGCDCMWPVDKYGHQEL